jgi:hypothetical protein
MICKDCRQETDCTANDRCLPCANVADAKWREKMSIRLDTSTLDKDKLVAALFTQHWMHECKIIPDYMPPFPGKDTHPTCQIEYTYESGGKTYLRHSNGPLQGFFWDIYGSDFHYPELAVAMLAQAPAPPRVGVVIQTHGK